MRRVPVSQPMLDGEEARHVGAALSAGAISGFFGDYLKTFEDEFAAYCDCKHGVAVTSGTTALHLALVTVGVGSGDEVLVASLTNMATFFAVVYQGAKPIPIDSDPDTLNLDPSLLRARITPKTKAILVVHLFGHPVDMDPVMEVAREFGIPVIEDCAEAHGALYKGRKVGGIGDIGCFSFYANKIITTGEGGMLTLNNPDWAAKARSLKSLAFGDVNKFMHKDIGFNYRMTNLQAAIGHAQFGKIEQIISAKRAMAGKYAALLGGRDDLVLPSEKPYARNVYWMYHVLLRGRNRDRRTQVMKYLADHGVECRENFLPFDMQDVFIERGLTRKGECPVADDLGVRGFYIPSSPTITDDEIAYVSRHLIAALDA